MIYPYSQQDIPAPAKSHSVSGKYHGAQDLNIQKSVSYNLGTKIETAPPVSKEIFTPSSPQSAAYSSQEQTYYPSTLFSTVNQGGMVGDLSASFPSQQQLTASTTVPVIILRVYTNQLADQAIYPNLPQTHPYANNLNSINLQSILSNYIQQYMYQMSQQLQNQYQTSYPPQSNNNKLIYQGYQGQNYYQTSPVTYQQYQQPHVPQTVTQDLSQNSHKHHALPTSENYPSDSHTRVIYHGPKGHLPPSTYTNKITYSNQQYAKPSSPASYAANSQEVYTDANGQSFVYLYPSQIKALQAQNQGYYQPQGHQQDYAQDYQQQYVSQEYQQPQVQEDRQYLPTPAPDKIYNYHAEAVKERTKKRSNGPITFEQKLKETVKKN